MAFPKIEGFVVTEKLGSGSYSTVYKAYTKIGARTTIAVKCIDKSRVKHSTSAIDNLISEIRLLKTLTHPHIVQMAHFTWDDRNIYIMMEYCCGGDLSKYIHRYGRVPELQVLYFLQQLASALKFLREKNVVHMDLKPHNLLLNKGFDGKYILKVADFGFAQHMSQECLRSVRGSPLYMAPEMIAGEYDARVDLWSVGVIMYECLFGRAPYCSNTFKELIDKIQRRAPIEIPPNSSISAGCQDLLTRLLQHDPDRRISYEDFFNHDYLDLEHMPSRDNYEKAVNLIKHAVELDSAGHFPAAFRAYTASLQYLVPAVRHEADALRRGALTDKLASYMERAEELKEFLQNGEVVPNNEQQRPVTNYETTHIAQTQDSQSTGSVSCAPQCNPCAKTTKDHGATPAANEPCTQVSEQARVKPSAANTPAPRLLRRLLGKQPPQLTQDDSSITQDSSDKAENTTDTTNDGCRIT